MRRAALSLALSVVGLAGSVLWIPSCAAAQDGQGRRVVVQRFRGSSGSSLRRAMIENLESSGVVVVGEAEVQEACRRLGFDGRLEGAQYVDLARELNINAYIEGVVQRHRRRWTATVRVRNAADGARLGTETWSGRTVASLRVLGRNGYQRLSRYLRDARAPAAASHASLPDGEVPWYARRSGSSQGPHESEYEGPNGNGDAEGDGNERAPSDPSTRYDALRLAVTGGTLFRFMETPVQVYESLRGLNPPDPASAWLTEMRSYQSGGIGHFELGARAELYPGAFEDQPFPYLGLVLALSHSLGVSSTGTNRSTGEAVSVPTEQFELYVGARGRYRFGPARSEPEIRVDAGYGALQFNLGTDELQLIEPSTIIPPMQYGHVHLSGGIGIGVVPEYLSLGLDVGYRIGTNIGGATRNVWGRDTGPANGFVMGIEAKLEVPEAPGLFFELHVSYFQFTTAFRGQAGCARQDDCAAGVNPWNDTGLWEPWPVVPPPPGRPVDLNAVVGGPTGPVHDNYFRTQLRVGYAFR